MDLRKLKKLIDLVQESGIAELEVTEGEEKVRIARTNAGSPQVYMPQHMQAPMPAPVAAVAAPIVPEEPVGHTLKAPMVGTFYRSPNPGSKPFVEVGQSVKEGEPLCIVEAMKLLNEIEADKTGVILSLIHI